MNQLKAYEITVKGKLEDIPLPDMENAIWARIEAQLDTDMPTDDGNNGPFNSPSGPLILGSSILAFLITLLTLYFTQKNSDNSSATIENQNKTFQNSASGDADADPPGNDIEFKSVAPASSTGDLPNNPSSLRNGSLVNQNAEINPNTSDVGKGQQEVQQRSGDQPGFVPGSNVQQNPVPGSNAFEENLPGGQVGNQSSAIIQAPKDQAKNQSGIINKPPPKDSIAPGKKTRGVKGVTDNDYRIVPKKDN